jgi:hypothetical protein
VVLKIDIDAPMVEQALIEQVLSSIAGCEQSHNGNHNQQIYLQVIKDPDVHERIDELFFEHHVNFAPMVKSWRDVINKDELLEDSYRIFTDLRKKGIRAHGWP